MTNYDNAQAEEAKRRKKREETRKRESEAQAVPYPYNPPNDDDFLAVGGSTGASALASVLAEAF